MSQRILNSSFKFYTTFLSIIQINRGNLHQIMQKKCYQTNTLLSNLAFLGNKCFANQIRLHSKRLPSLIEMCLEISKREGDILFSVQKEIAKDLSEVLFVKELKLTNKRVSNLVNYLLPSAFSCSGTLILLVNNFYAAQRRFKNKGDVTEENHFRLVSIICWIHELLIRGAAMQDDIIDGNHTRNNIQCWHTLNGTGLQAIRDAFILEEGCFILLRKYFRKKEYYADLFDHYIECLYGMNIGLTQTEVIQPSLNPKMSDDMKHLIACKRYGWGYCYIYGAFTSAMMINEVRVPHLMDFVKEVAFDTALILSISEDLIDCYGTSKVNERKPTDIVEGKQTWLYWKALELANSTQTDILKESYGQDDSEAVKRVKAIYNDLNIQHIVQQHLEEMDANIHNKVAGLPQGEVPWNVLLKIVKFYRGVRSGIYVRP